MNFRTKCHIVIFVVNHTIFSYDWSIPVVGVFLRIFFCDNKIISCLYEKNVTFNLLIIENLHFNRCFILFFFFYENRAKIKKCFFFKKYDFRSIFLQKFCFLYLIFVRFSQQFPQNIFPAGNLLKKSDMGNMYNT